MTEWYDIPIYRLTDAKFVQYTLSIPGEREERTVAKMDKNNAETLEALLDKQFRVSEEKQRAYTDSVKSQLTARIDDVETRLTARMDGLEKKVDTPDKRLTDTEKDLMDTIAEVEANLIRHMNRGFGAMNKRMDNLESLTMMAVRASRQSQDILNILLDHQQRIETLESKMA